MMKLETVVKYHNPHSVTPFIPCSPLSPETMTGTDIMAALGMVQKRAPLGFSAFCAKMNLSHHETHRAIRLLTLTGMQESVRYTALTKLSASKRLAVVEVIARHAFDDYARSPETQIVCRSCQGSGLTKGKCCSKCQGKGTVRAACKDCKGRGLSIDRIKTELYGLPVYQHCRRCNGRGFDRIPSTVVFRAVCQVTRDISLDTWNKSVKPLLTLLISELHREEAWAEKQFMSITK